VTAVCGMRGGINGFSGRCGLTGSMLVGGIGAVGSWPKATDAASTADTAHATVQS
jgi:hypothetical protein